MNKNSIVFLGTPDISAKLLEFMILKGFNIIGVITQEDKPKGRKKILTPSYVCLIADKYNIPCYKPHKLNLDYQFLIDLNPDLLLTFAYGQILSEKVLSFSKYKPLNIHTSLLPKYRGASPIQAALYNGDKITGVSLMEMVKEMDAGDIYAQEIVEINAEDNYTSLSSKLCDKACELVLNNLDKYFNNELVGIKQDTSKVFIVHKILKEDEHLNLYVKPHDFVNQVRSLANEPGGYLVWNDQNLKILKCEYYSDEIIGATGEIIKCDKNEILLQVEKGIVSLKLLQKSGKNICTNKEFYNGNNNFKGTILK